MVKLLSKNAQNDFNYLYYDIKINEMKLNKVLQNGSSKFVVNWSGDTKLRNN